MNAYKCNGQWVTTKYSDGFKAGALVTVVTNDPRWSYAGKVKRSYKSTAVPAIDDTTPSDWRIVADVERGGALCVHKSMLREREAR